MVEKLLADTNGFDQISIILSGARLLACCYWSFIAENL